MPSENLPYLYAVYAVSWAAFFVYVFFISRHQREIEREIEELKQTLATKENPGEPAGRSGV